MQKNTHKYPPNYRWNFTMGVLHGIIFSFGMAFSEPFSVLPLFLRSFTSSKVVIGFLISIIKTGSALPQFFVANKVQNLSRGKPILLVAIWVRWLAWGLLAMVTFIGGHHSPHLILASFVFFLFIFSFAGGVANVPFFNMIAKAIFAERRGSFFGMRQFWGGIAAIGAGLLVRIILSLPSLSFPQNYGYLFLVTFAVLTFGYVALSLFKEPESRVEKTAAENNSINLPTIIHYLKDFPPLFHLLLILIFSQSLMLALPFFVLNAKETLHFPTAWVGYFVMAQMGGGVLSNFLWAKLSDQRGNVLVIRLSIICALLAVLFAVFSKSFILYLFVFIFSGIFLNGAGIGFNNYIMELSTEQLRPLFLSIQGTFMFPVYFYPLFGGLIADYFSFHILFLSSLFMLLISLWLSIKLCEPRRKEAVCVVANYINEI
ncbi:major Facilitator Superfamily protein [bacterium BMS3Abin05]|nr:major Facilitator Superfamily protein [bacterium BMS3Abin05]GBE26631.1 major Facilitator Superfamily protein [bacterium BMS3Bbin03]